MNPATPSRFLPRVTVAAVIAREVGGRTQYLLVEEETPEGLRLNNPAGHLDAGESPLEGAVRETLEETACAFVPEALLGVYLSRVRRPTRGEDLTYVRLAFAGTAGEPEPGRTLDAGIVRTLWLTLDELRANAARHRSPLLLECVEDHARGRRFPLELVTTHASVFAPPVAS
jgi:8-oxo-dGTP pyrophosphatase MutT (NUDIX family)